MQQGRERFRNRVIPIVLLIGAALVLLAACGDGGGGYAIVALPAGAGWWSGVRQSRIVGAVSQLAGGRLEGSGIAVARRPDAWHTGRRDFCATV